jgi:hypothetical protein
MRMAATLIMGESVGRAPWRALSLVSKSRFYRPEEARSTVF